MLNRLTPPQLHQLAAQLNVVITPSSEKSWIVDDILSLQSEPPQTDRATDLTEVHDALLRLEQTTDDPSISNARQLIKAHLYDSTHDRTTVGQIH